MLFVSYDELHTQQAEIYEQLTQGNSVGILSNNVLAFMLVSLTEEALSRVTVHNKALHQPISGYVSSGSGPIGLIMYLQPATLAERLDAFVERLTRIVRRTHRLIPA